MLWLDTQGLLPVDLLITGNQDLIDESTFPFDRERVSKLLGRGLQLSRAVERWTGRGIWVTCSADPHYPSAFKDRLGKHTPPLLYGCGDIDLLESGGLAVVGSRGASDGLLEYTMNIGRLAAESQYAIVSGGARGVDQAAMTGCLDNGGVVLCVLADRLERVALAYENRGPLMEGQLVVVSPYDPQAGFNVGNAMQRNKMIFAFADAGLVVASDYGKGGTWAGATEQLDRLRLVPIYVRQSQDYNKAVNVLVSKGALVWPEPRTSDEFMKVMRDVEPSYEMDTPNAQLTYQTAALMDASSPEYDSSVAVVADSSKDAEASADTPEQYSLDLGQDA